jgi:hypothetical protein
MTIFEAISAKVYPFDVDKNVILDACTEEEINSSETYVKSVHKVSVVRAAICVLRMLLSLSSEGNSGYSLSYDKEGLEKRITYLAKDIDQADTVSDLRPTISAYKDW